MNEEQMIAYQHELRTLIDDSKNLIDQNKAMIVRGETTFVKMNRTLKGFILTAIPIVITFFYSFVDSRTKLATMEETKLSKSEADVKYATHADVIFLQNDIYDINNSTFAYRPNVTEQRMELSYTKALKQFLGDVTRSADNQQ